MKPGKNDTKSVAWETRFCRANASGVSPETIANLRLRERLANERGARRRRAKPRAAA